MKTITAIIVAKGGWDRLRTNPIKVINPGYMSLCIERIGQGPRGLPLVSVAMYGKQCGDLMRDPDLEMEVDWSAGKWMPTRFRNDYLGVEHEAVEMVNGMVVEDRALIADLLEFMRSWDLDLRIQGFLEAAKKA
jgi:hypothetical protein